MSRAFCVLAFLVLFTIYSGRVSSQTNNPNSQSATSSAAAKEPIRRVSLVTSEANAEAKQLYEDGLKLNDAGQFPQAAEKFQQAIKNDSNYADAYAALGRAYFKMRQWQNAIDNLRRAAALSSKQRDEQDALQQKLKTQASVATTNQPSNTSINSVPAKPQFKKLSSTPPIVTKIQSLPGQRFLAFKVALPFNNSLKAIAKPTPPETTRTNEETQQAVGERVSLSHTATAQPLEANSVIPLKVSAPNDVSLTKIYRVGPGDVIDVRLNDAQSPASTLFTVTPAGFLEHPALADPLPVSGLTVEEIASKLEDDLKRRAIIENPRAIVGVRDYTSHTVLVSGLVKDSGTKFLRREAIPLYVVVADAQPLPEAAKVSVVRTESNQVYEIDLAHAAEMNLLVRPGDVISLQPNETQFVYIGGEVRLPGEKTFRRGLTLTQAIITAGGVGPKAKLAQIDRDDGRGFLVGTRFSLKEISSGKAADPILKPGDRITITR